jgi:hypothetical protein
MRRKLRVVATVAAAAAALYALGVWAMAITPAPWGVIWTFPLALLAGAAARLVERPAERRAMRRYRGECEHCTYDLRATPNQCPECGRSTW